VWSAACATSRPRRSPRPIRDWIFRPNQKAARLWCYLEHGKAKRGRRRARTSKDRLEGKVHVSERSDGADARAAAETIAVMMAALGRLTPPMRGSVTFDKPRQQASGSSPAGTEVSRPRRDSRTTQPAPRPARRHHLFL